MVRHRDKRSEGARFQERDSSSLGAKSNE
jgi:hypothetical protein